MTPAAIDKRDLSTLSNAQLIADIRLLRADIRLLRKEIARLISVSMQKDIRIENLEKENLELTEGRRVQAKSYDALAYERQKDAEVSAVVNRRLSKLRSAIDEILKLGNSAEALDGRLSQMAADAALSRVQLLAVIRAMLDIAGDCISSDGITKEA